MTLAITESYDSNLPANEAEEQDCPVCQRRRWNKFGEHMILLPPQLLHRNMEQFLQNSNENYFHLRKFYTQISNQAWAQNKEMFRHAKSQEATKKCKQGSKLKKKKILNLECRVTAFEGRGKKEAGEMYALLYHHAWLVLPPHFHNSKSIKNFWNVCIYKYQ